MSSTSKLTHFDAEGAAHMVDVGGKSATHRVAIASGKIYMQRQTIETILAGSNKKGDVLGIARTAGIMAAKRTADLVPLCHPLAITKVSIDFKPDSKSNTVKCTARVETHGQTGVEMEALTAVHIALLTIYDMCKAIDRGMKMSDIALDEKTGGESGHWKRVTSK